MSRKFYHIETYLDGTYPLQEQKSFIFKSRCQCYFLEQALADLQFDAPYSRLNILCTKNPQNTYTRPRSPEPYLEVCILFDLEGIESLTVEALYEPLHQIIVSGLNAASSITPLPVSECIQRLREFKEGGYVNQWVQFDKHWKRWGCRCVVEAEITTEKFILNQSVFLNGAKVATRCVATTKPRDFLFYDYLGTATINNDGHLIYKARGVALTTFSLAEKRFVHDDKAEK